MISH
ncbi:hypothetical protein VTH06DRAFT_2515 [Thermothelomyces fergusii]|jgi:sulfonate dioxygenase